MSSYTVTCGSCGTANRIPADKQGKTGRCGTCHAPLPPMYYQPRPLDEKNFDTFIREYDGPVLAEFWAPWCPHCTSYAPALRRVAELLAGKAAVVQVNSQENPVLAGRFGVSGIPVVFLLRNGRIVDQLGGAQTAEALLAWFRRQH
ncbi:MAG: thioredoxin domain-containing protein [Desulfuromonadaceae bacterium]